jgi:hypothetical protein
MKVQRVVHNDGIDARLDGRRGVTQSCHHHHTIRVTPRD